MISEGPLSAKVVLVGAQRTNCDPEGPPKFLIFPSVIMEKKYFTPYGPPWAPLWLWAPGKSSGCPTLSPGLDMTTITKPQLFFTDLALIYEDCNNDQANAYIAHFETWGIFTLE